MPLLLRAKLGSFCSYFLPPGSRLFRGQVRHRQDANEHACVNLDPLELDLQVADPMGRCLSVHANKAQKETSLQLTVHTITFSFSFFPLPAMSTPMTPRKLSGRTDSLRGGVRVTHGDARSSIADAWSFQLRDGQTRDVIVVTSGHTRLGAEIVCHGL